MYNLWLAHAITDKNTLNISYMVYSRTLFKWLIKFFKNSPIDYSAINTYLIRSYGRQRRCGTNQLSMHVTDCYSIN